jgi:hypothetical protein
MCVRMLYVYVHVYTYVYVHVNVYMSQNPVEQYLCKFVHGASGTCENMCMLSHISTQHVPRVSTQYYACGFIHGILSARM